MTKQRDWRRAYRLSKRLWHYQTVRLDHDDAAALRDLADYRMTAIGSERTCPAKFIFVASRLACGHMPLDLARC
jgi:hypothetical protein